MRTAFSKYGIIPYSAALLALLLATVAFAAEPDAHPYKLRLYNVECRELITNLRANALHRDPASPYSKIQVYLLHTGLDSLADMQKTAKELDALGIPSIPGMRYLPDSTMDYLNAAKWATKADELKQICAMRLHGDRRVQFDIENYTPPGDECSTNFVSANGGRPRLIAAMDPFLNVLRAERVIPCIHPANVLDEVDRAMCFATEANEQMHEGEFSQEDDSLSQSILANLPWSLQREIDFRKYFPNFTYVPGFRLRGMRNVNAVFRDTILPNYPGESCWFFLGLEDRIPERMKLMGTQEWLELPN